MKSFLLIGQSNMAGRGDFGEVPDIKNKKCFMLRNGRFVGRYTNVSMPCFQELNGVFHQLAEDFESCGVVSAEGLVCRKDRIHFDSKSLREFGIRYFKKYLEMLG